MYSDCSQQRKAAEAAAEEEEAEVVVEEQPVVAIQDTPGLTLEGKVAVSRTWLISPVLPFSPRGILDLYLPG